MQNIDKLAIGAAILFIIGGLAFPYAFESAADLSELSELTNTVQEIERSQALPNVEESQVLNSVRDCFSVEETNAFAEWSVYRRPARVKTWTPYVAQPPVHEPSAVTRVESRRDTDLRRPVLDVEVRIGKIERATLTGAEIQLKAGEGEWVTKGTVEGRSGDVEKLTFNDLELGKDYWVRVVTRVKADDPGVNGGFQREQVSEPSGEAVWLPVDQNWTGKSFVKMKVLESGGISPDKVTVQLDYYDYDTGKFKKIQEFQLEFENVQGWKQGKPLCGTEFRLYKIFWGKDRPYVEIRDPAGNLLARKLYKGAQTLNMETDSWVAPEPVKDTGDDGGMTEDPETSGASSGDDGDGDNGGFFDD